MLVQEPLRIDYHQDLQIADAIRQPLDNVGQVRQAYFSPLGESTNSARDEVCINSQTKRARSYMG
jgi:hypothetical protein